MMLLIGMLRVPFRGGQKEIERKIAFSTRQYAAAFRRRVVTRKTKDTNNNKRKSEQGKREKNNKKIKRTHNTSFTKNPTNPNMMKPVM